MYIYFEKLLLELCSEELSIDAYKMIFLALLLKYYLFIYLFIFFTLEFIFFLVADVIINALSSGTREQSC